MIRADRDVYIVAREGRPLKRLDKLGLLSKIPNEHVVDRRIAALKRIENTLPEHMVTHQEA